MKIVGSREEKETGDQIIDLTRKAKKTWEDHQLMTEHLDSVITWLHASSFQNVKLHIPELDNSWEHETQWQRDNRRLAWFLSICMIGTMIVWGLMSIFWLLLVLEEYQW